MKNLEGSVELAGSAFYNMLRSVIENIEPHPNHSREIIGDLLGKKIKYDFICVNAYPLTRTKGRLCEVYSPEKNLDRVRELNKVTNNRRGLGTSLIGDYHSHICLENEYRSGLNKYDIQDAIEHIRKNNKAYWLSIILTLRRKKYKTPKEQGEFLLEYSRKLRVILRARFKPDELPDAPEYKTKTLNAYDFIISAYLLEKRGDRARVKELKVRKRKIKVKSI